MPSKRLMKKGVAKAKFDRAVGHVKAKGDVDNPYAVATAAFNKQKGLKSKRKK